MNTLVLFGSKSDERVYAPLVEELKKFSLVQFHVASAHRDPEKLAKILEESTYDLVIGGAGLSAHLPGVIASKTKKPVLGLPICGNFFALDAFLSILQMPSGVPVLSSGPENNKALLGFIKNLKEIKNKNILNVLSKEKISKQDLVKMEGLANAEGVELTYLDEVQPELLNIVPVTEASDVKSDSHNVIYVPVVSKRQLQMPEEAIKVFELSKLGGLWLGTNNFKNAIHMFDRLRGIL